MKPAPGHMTGGRLMAGRRRDGFTPEQVGSH